LKQNIIEMLVHTALNTHKEPTQILIIADNQQEFQLELNKHKFLNLETTFAEEKKGFETLQNSSPETFDIIILASMSDEVKMLAHSNRVLKNKGLISAIGDFQALKTLASEFRIAMPYFVNSLDEKSETLLFGSKFYHPTADINLQRADFLDKCNYYNSDIQNSSFVVPNFIKNAIKDFVRN